MNISNYKAYISAETMMGPNSARILAELFDKYPISFVPDDIILYLGCGTGLTSLIIAKETGAKVFANDLWVSAEENGKRFAEWGVREQITPVCEDANNLHFPKEQFRALISIGDNDRIESVTTWEMDCFSKAWDDWLTTNNKYALSDRKYFETIIKPYTCFVGIYIKLKEAL